MLKKLQKSEKKIFYIHLIYSILEGITLGIFVLNEFIFIKTLNGSEFQLGLLLQFSMVVFFFAIFFHELIKRFKKKNILILTALVTRLPLLIIAFFPHNNIPDNQINYYHYLFLSIFFLYYLATPVVFPIINSILKNNYNEGNFGKLYSYSTSVNKIMMLLATFIFGYFLDINNHIYIYIYPVLSIMSIFSIYLLSRGVKIDYLEKRAKFSKISESIKKSFLNMVNIIKSNKPYRDFEIGFMLYGFAFMLTIAVITIFLADRLNLNYTSIAFYKNSYNIIAIISLPLFGKLIEKTDPRKFGAFSFLSLLLYILFMGLTEYFPYYTDAGNYRFYWFLLISFAFNGLFAGSMPLLWNIGSAYFCKKEDVASYQSIHLTMVGFRGLFAPLFGVGLYKFIGFSGVFVLGIMFLLLAIFVMLYSIKRNKLLRSLN